MTLPEDTKIVLVNIFPAFQNVYVMSLFKKVPRHENGPGKLFQPVEDMLFILAKSSIYMHTKNYLPPFYYLFWNKRFVSVCWAYAYKLFDSELWRKEGVPDTF